VSHEPRRGIPALPIQHLDPDATRPSGFTSTPKLPKGKATATSVSVHLPLKEWAIGAAILSSQEVTPELLTQLIWEAGVLKVRDANGSIPFELQVEKGSIDGVKYVDIKVRFFPLGRVSSSEAFCRGLLPWSLSSKSIHP
jgi:hypothetical protein